MHGVILAAGIGSRLKPLTLERHKACVTVGDDPIVVHQLRAFAASPVDEVHVLTGYLSDQVAACCRDFADGRDDISVSVRECEVFANTNNMYSLYEARDAVAGEPFVLANGDVVFEPRALERLVESDADSAIACDASTYDEEAMKVTVDDDGRVDHISKDVPESRAAATSIDCYRFSAAFSATLFDEIVRRIEVDEAYDCWTEVAIDGVLQSGRHDVRPVDVDGANWVEVDDHDDLLAADWTFSDFEDLRSKEAVFFDLDGTLYLDDELVDGAADVVGALRASGTDVYFLSNNSSGWKTDYAEKLSRLGVPATPDQVVLSTDGVIEYLTENGTEDAYAVGTAAMRTALSEAGVDPTASDPEAVVVAFDTELSYEKVREATLAVRDGAEFLLAHPDMVCPTADGLVPDCGSIGALVAAATDREPSRVFGKPNAEMLAPVMDEHDLDPADVAVVGDRLDTDVQMAANVGCESICVLSGDASRVDVETHELSPTLVVDSVGAFEYPDLTTSEESSASGTVQESS
ncbi:HAD-IIA family hydrolase [Halorubellus sp. JP-L1]|nr:HAD-IIA family hydrolase [Halorubellus sp. JP-L1]NHN42709.1 HAD-IIA family hydrolase [Halorubellus sp. JP-L1]